MAKYDNEDECAYAEEAYYPDIDSPDVHIANEGVSAHPVLVSALETASNFCRKTRMRWHTDKFGRVDPRVGENVHQTMQRRQAEAKRKIFVSTRKSSALIGDPGQQKPPLCNTSVEDWQQEQQIDGNPYTYEARTPYAFLERKQVNPLLENTFGVGTRFILNPSIGPY